MLWGSAGQPAARAPTDATELTSEGERWSEHHALYRTTVGAAQHSTAQGPLREQNEAASGWTALSSSRSIL